MHQPTGAGNRRPIVWHGQLAEELLIRQTCASTDHKPVGVAVPTSAVAYADGDGDPDAYSDDTKPQSHDELAESEPDHELTKPDADYTVTESD